MTKTKIALVTGGSRGLGKNAALALASKGHDIIITYNSQKEKAEEVVKEITALGQKAAVLQFDSGKSGAVKELVNNVKDSLNKNLANRPV